MPTYADLLNSVEWRDKRLQIIGRDKNKCQFCLNEKYLKHQLISKGYIRNTGGSLSSSRSSAKAPYLIDIVEPRSDRIFIADLFFDNYDHHSDLIAYYVSNNSQARIIALHKQFIPSIFDRDLRIRVFSRHQFDDIREENKKNILSVLEKQENWNEVVWDYIIGLNVHHRCYRIGKRPWEYDNKDLITACEFCHNEIHEPHNNKVPVFDHNENVISFYTACHRCNGVGFLPQFSHVQAGICFRCNGAQYDELIRS